ncbi:hypothetical protein BDV33DRAFT_199197 [Aspergillus novoparasiticus]|uniref:Carrier domain-containing protein n=1 Tax=Aspergillus novoparasiticus TaxID=986946 RepID=A0A5N6F856_9EURO|nr:hypothetical protein BDV33DRAFT_199197 [Aspergillus novoparasiticus]
MSTTSQALKTLSKIEYVIFAGGPLSAEAGNTICKHCKLIPLIGSTELGHIPPTKSKAAPEDWKYHQWPYYPDVHMELHDEGLYEMVIRRSPDGRLLHGVFYVFPELQEWRTKDLFSKHPTEDGLWRFESRTDDIIVLANGEKVNSIEMEAIIEGHDLVHKAMIAGRGLTECVLLVEPDWDKFRDRDLDGSIIDEIWDSVESANKQGPEYAYIEKDRIGIASREKPFQLNSKGTLRRALVSEDYESKISALGNNDPLNPLGSSNDAFKADDVQTFIRQVVSSVSQNLELAEETDFFATGLDSRQNTLAQVIVEIIQCGKDSKKNIPASVINLVNPRTTWATLLPTIQRRFGANPVSLQSWVRTLDETGAANVENRPAYKLLSFYERLARGNSDDSFPQFETNKANASSPTFRALGPIDLVWCIYGLISGYYK